MSSPSAYAASHTAFSGERCKQDSRCADGLPRRNSSECTHVFRDNEAVLKHFLCIWNAQLLRNLLCCCGNEGKQEQCRMPERLGEVAQKLDLLLALEGPRLRCIDTGVECGDEFEDLLDSQMHVHTVHGLSVALPSVAALLRVFCVILRKHDCSTFFLEQNQNAIQQVSQLIAELTVIKLLDPLPRKVAIIADRNFMAEVEPERIGVTEKLREHCIRNDDIARAFAHFLPFTGEKAVDEKLIGRTDTGMLEHRRPDESVEPRDVFPDDMGNGGVIPPFDSKPAEAVLSLMASPFIQTKTIEAGNIIRQRVAPHIHRLPFIPGNRNATRQRRFRAREGNVFEPLIDERQRFVFAKCGNNVIVLLQ